jgi:biopolymer transport protein ExbB
VSKEVAFIVTLGANKANLSPEKSMTMLAAHLANLFSSKTQLIALAFFQASDEAVRFDPVGMWNNMAWPARSVAIILIVMSAWSIGVMIDRGLAFRLARKQSRQFAPVVAGALREGKLDEAILVAERNRKSHLAKVVSSGLREFNAQSSSPATPDEQIEASKLALDRAEAVAHAELERGLAGLATIGSTAPFVGLLGTVIGIIDAFAMIQKNHATGVSAVSGGISEALVTTALGLFVAIPAVMMFNYFTGKIKAFDVEMNNSSSELMAYLMKRNILSRR